MNHFYSVNDVEDMQSLLSKIDAMKANPFAHSDLGKNKTLVMLFFNPSLRTRLSTQRAAFNLGIQVISMDMKDAWKWEIEQGKVMQFDTAEHIKEAAHVISSYADIIAMRSFPTLTDRKRDMKDEVIRQFIHFSSRPVINLESAIRHPLQSLADLYTIEKHSLKENPKIVLSWAPHPKALPHAVANSFLEWMHAAGHSVTVTQPKGYELDGSFMRGHTVVYNQAEALENADFVYVKNWSSVSSYGKILQKGDQWMITKAKLEAAGGPRLLHCLPVRRNVVISDDAMDSEYSLIQSLAANRLWAAQAVLHEILSAKEKD